MKCISISFLLLASLLFTAPPIHAQSDDQPKPDAPKPADASSDEKKSDPSDIRNAIGNLSLVRGLEKSARATKPGLWSKLVDQPYYTPEIRAEKLLFFGQYPQAEAHFQELLQSDPRNQKFLEGRAEAILRNGRQVDLNRFDELLASLSDPQRSTPRMLRLRAESLLQRGRNAEARDLLKRYIDTHPSLEPLDAGGVGGGGGGDVVTLYTTYAQALEDDAEYAAAAGIYAKLLPLAEGNLPDDPQIATQLAFALERHSLLTGIGREKHRTVLFELGQIERHDETYWPAKLVEARILLNSHNTDDGAQAIAEVLDLNPNALRARLLAVDFAIQQYNFEDARDQLDQIADAGGGSDLAEVNAYEGRLLLKERLPEKAIAPLLQATTKNPRLPEARGWLAAAYYLLADEKRMQEQLDAIRIGGATGNMVHPVALFEAGEVLRDARQFSKAEQCYLDADKAAKWWSEPSAALAQLYLETGQEARAKAAYDKSFAIDPYNMRAYNQIILLNYLQKFATLESKTRLTPGSNLPAFIIKYEPQDEILAHLAMNWMEKVRPELWSYFQIQELPAPTQIEMFPSHEQFGVRTTGLPWIGTVGACTGNVIAMDVPRAASGDDDTGEGGGAGDSMGNFDWARVLRHEYTHTVTLALTKNRIPHWLTEAAACNQEQAPRDWDNCQLLASNFRAGTLFKISELNWGFIRPKRSIDRQLAYMEAQWLYEYLVATYGLPKMLDFMRCFRDGLYEAKAWEKAYGKSMADMDAEFHAWAKAQIDSWGLPTDPLPNLADLDAALAKNPNDVESLVKLAWLLAGGGHLPQAQAQLEKAVDLDPKNIRARELLGAVLSQLKQTDRARQLLEAVLKDDPHRPVTLRTLGLIAMSLHDYDAAENYLTKLQAERPLEETSYLNLAGIYLLKKDNKNAIGQLLELQRHEQKDERIPRKLAELFRAENNLPEAEASAYRAIRIDPYNAINHELMAQILMDEKQPQRAIEYWKDATTLQPKIPEFWEGLADAYGATGDPKAAADAAKKAIDLQPTSPARKWLQSPK
ncbi:MAG TPA: tetratricopeptide repeat protein [Phycisphaerae bacterium]|nr:tetratricopeptide repeat protein [Phycisphaerae bacterium]